MLEIGSRRPGYLEDVLTRGDGLKGRKNGVLSYHDLM